MIEMATEPDAMEKERHEASKRKRNQLDEAEKEHQRMV